MSIAFLISTQGLLQYSKLCGEKINYENPIGIRRGEAGTFTAFRV